MLSSAIYMRMYTWMAVQSLSLPEPAHIFNLTILSAAVVLHYFFFFPFLIFCYAYQTHWGGSFHLQGGAAVCFAHIPGKGNTDSRHGRKAQLKVTKSPLNWRYVRDSANTAMTNTTAGKKLVCFFF